MSSSQDRPTILIVDDRPENLLAMEKLLKKMDVDIVKAGSGNEALTSSLYNDFALIILDIQMPEMDGYEVANILKSSNRTVNIPIIFITAIDRDDSKEIKGYDKGAVDFIFKPFNEYILLSKVKIFLEIYKMKTGLEALVTERTKDLEESNTRLKQEIINKIQAEEALKESEFELTIRNEIARVFLTVPDEEMYREVLQVILRASKSEYGVLGFIDEDGALVCPSLTRDIWDKCKIPDKDIVFPRDIWGGIWGRALLEKKTLYSNQPLHVPEGHVAIQRAVAVPIIHQDLTIGLLQIANKTIDYSKKDIRLLESISGYIAPVLDARLQRDRKELERKRVERELRDYRDHLEELVKERTKELEVKARELEKANIEILEADRLKSVFLASMSHELRTPLNSIIGFTGIILQGMSGEINEEQIKQLTMVKNSADHLLSLINDLLDIAKIEAGKAEPTITKFKLNDVIREVTEVFSPSTKEKGLEFTTKLSEDITIISDRRRIKQILLNLVSNAVKFTDLGEIKVAGKIGGNNLEMRIIDTGIGLKEVDMKRLFQPFQQIDTSHITSKDGTGLGLHLAKKLSTLLGGDISARSEYGKGSEFIFVVPLRPNI